jgi:intracellular sulfur oxidation DsrE/DsrF family protein
MRETCVKKQRAMIIAAVAAVAMSLGALAAQAAEKVHRLAIQISDNDKEKMTAVLNVAANVSKAYAGRGEPVEIRVVAFNAGLHLLRKDTSPVRERVESFAKSLPDVEFKACGVTIDAMARKEGKPPQLVPNAGVVPGGVVTLMELHEAGWTIIRP